MNIIRSSILLVVCSTLLSFSCTAQDDGESPCPAEGVETSNQSVYGRVLGESDVETLPDAPLQALVIAVRSVRIDSLFAEASLDSTRKKMLHRLRLNLSDPLFHKYVESYACSDVDGSYHMKIPPGAYHFCLCLHQCKLEPKDFPIVIHGCTQVTVPDGNGKSLDILWGEGGVSSR